jgi:hypothetical protein
MKSNAAKIAERINALRAEIDKLNKDNARLKLLFAFAAIKNGGEFRISTPVIDPKDYHYYQSYDETTKEVVFHCEKKSKDEETQV